MFENLSCDGPNITCYFSNMVEDYCLYAKSVFGSPASGCGSPSSWFPPSMGQLKVNFDARVSTNGEVGLGVVVREFAGRIIMLCVKRVEVMWDASMAKVMAAYAIELVQRFGHDGIIVEGESLLVVNALKRKQEGCSPLFSSFW